MIKTYDEALKTLNDVRTYLAIGKADGCVEELDKVARYFINEKHKENPTFSECIKEWEEKGFKVEICNRFTYIIDLENYYSFIIDKLTLRYHTNSCWITIELSELLTKTLKALEETKNDNNR